MEQGEIYFVAKITTDSVDSESGKVKKVKEEKLVKGFTPTDVEKYKFLEKKMKNTEKH